jgi:hypothetical protein
MSYVKPSTAIARILRHLGLKQGSDFRVKGQYKGSGANRERIGTYVAVLTKDADQVVADHADEIEQMAANAGHSFRVSIHFTAGGRMWTWVANYGQRTRDAAPVATADRDGAVLDNGSRKAAHELDRKIVGGPATLPGYTAKLGAPRPAFPLPDAETAAELAQGAAAISHHVAASVLADVELDTDAADRQQAVQDTPSGCTQCGRNEGHKLDCSQRHADAHPYDGLAQRWFGPLLWACQEAGQVWFFQNTRNSARYVLRVYNGRAQVNGWYLSGPGVGEPGSSKFMGATLTIAATAAEEIISEHRFISAAMERTARQWPKGTRVQGVDGYGVTCMGTVNGAGWGVVTAPGHENYGRTWVDVDWDEMPHNRGTGRRNRPFTDDLIRH